MKTKEFYQGILIGAFVTCLIILVASVSAVLIGG